MPHLAGCPPLARQAVPGVDGTHDDDGLIEHTQRNLPKKRAWWKSQRKVTDGNSTPTMPICATL
ncbi:hypothetical protein ColTof4_11488 [Colletotrichum tofieldiae]|nr:hypothetical protein ColTof4_11488 [Colletotrichum tofieldiae]